MRWLDASGQRIWQMLPLGPTDAWGSPYSSPSAKARNTLLISLDDLVDAGWLLGRELPDPTPNPHSVDFQNVMNERNPVLRQAAERVREQVDLKDYRAANSWVESWALYATLCEGLGNSWTQWPEAIRDRDADTLGGLIDEHHDKIERHIAQQWLFDQQWQALRVEAKERGIQMWGDIPFFVAAESCDTWEHRELFRLDESGRPTVTSGVPPDAFSAEGQRWGHALYDENAHRGQGYQWWISRIDAVLSLVDDARLDHFRGLCAYWEIPADAQSAKDGHWTEGPGQPLLDALREHLGTLPFIAEDLGVITEDVEALRDNNNLPGMAILQFAFGTNTDHPFLPHNHRKGLVVYPGTHDNDTCVGWYRSASELAQDHVRRYLSTDGRDIAGDLLRCALRSVADTAILQMQDVLSLDSGARMNVPGQGDGNWSWRLVDDALNLALARRLRDQVTVSGR